MDFIRNKRVQELLCITVTVLLFISCNGNKPASDISKDQSTMMSDTPGFKSGYSDVNGLKMYYEIHGQGKPLVLVHGGGSTIETSFGRIIPSLAKHRQVIAVELQAHGRTSDRDQPETFEQDADDVAGLLQNLHIEQADFFGFSNGGQTTILIANRHPELVHKIILGSAFYKREGAYSWLWETIGDATLKDMPQQLQEGYLKLTPDSAGLMKMFTKDKERMAGFKDWSDEMLQSIKVATLIVIGDKDVVTPEHAVKMYRLMPNCELAIIPGAHGEYMGEITTATSLREDQMIVPLLEEFLDRKN
jgi:pimeloyl-ACP methyl ester carboxylesterase